MSQIDRNLFQNSCSLRATRQRRQRWLVTGLAGTVFSLGALTTLQAASESSGPLPEKQSVHAGSSHVLAVVASLGWAADTLPYTLLTSVPPPAAAAVTSLPVAQAPEALAAPAADFGNAKAVLAVVDQWAKAWQSKDVAGYLATYGAAFQPANGISRDAWAKLRQQRIADKQVIQLELRDIEIQAEAADRVRVNFVQDYRADQFVELGSAKSLLLALEKDGWRILAEESVR